MHTDKVCEGFTPNEVQSPRTPLSPEQREKLARLESLLKGLKCLQEKGLVHGDIKPENIIVRPPKPVGPAADFTPLTLDAFDLSFAREKKHSVPIRQHSIKR